MYLVDCGIWATPMPENCTISPRVWTRRLAALATLMPSSPQHVVGVEEGEDGRCVEVLEDLDADERGDHRLVHCAGYALGASTGGDALVAGDGRDDHPEDDAFDLAPVQVLQGSLGVEGADERATVDADEGYAGE